jgi:hypothetical protein
MMVARVYSYNCNHGAMRVFGLASHSARVLDASAIPRYKHSGIGSLRQPTQQGRSRVFAPIDRRFLLKSAAAFTVTLPFARPDRSHAAEAELIARRVLFDDADYGSVTVSPDGWHLSWLAPVDGVRNLFVARIDDLASARPVTRVIDRNIAAFYRWAQTNSHIIFFQDREGDENWRASSVNIRNSAVVALSPAQGVKSFVAQIDRKFATDVLLMHNGRDRHYFDLYRVSVLNGSSELLYENNEYAGLLCDGDFQLRLGVRHTADGSAEVFQRHASGSWSPFMTIPLSDLDGTDLLEFSADGKTLYMLDSRGRDKAALYAMDVATKKTTLLAADDEADIAHVSFFARRPLAARADKERARWHAVEPSALQDLADLGAYGAGDITFTGRSYGDRVLAAHFERDAESGEFVLLDRETREVRPLFKQRKALAGLKLRPLEAVTFPARDGLRLNGYLTRPDETSGKLPAGAGDSRRSLCTRFVGLLFGAPMAGESRLRGAQCELPGFDRLRQGVCDRGRPRMGRAHARRPDRLGRLGGRTRYCRPQACRLLRRQLWRLFGAHGSDKDSRSICLYRGPLRHFQSDDLHGDDPALLAAVVQCLEEPAGQSRHR